ncbi:MAG: metallophosphoesterase [Lentisphaerae bacterium]|jgi:predicted phosphodiesterase|nr:metallophosphoesterase [Lentisphaerota bacterium]MBT4821565.1 metallophosphoesterase [Lentisphaerota bacterium]MBT5604555.1 metallophosphoesterase [Lentisphaerota bacterium]MBT7061728.1 metallophosphoesterase [Lentisphaerota bacterium]MBT7848814.1 metallophosphoesterase [Lentisphaerota bacterium]
MRIAHISDIHVGLPPDGMKSLVDKRILGTLNFLLRRRRKIHLDWLAGAVDRLQALQPDWIVCTGDLTSVSSPLEFALAEGFMAPLLELCPERFLYVPGNHDVYVSDRRCEKALAHAFSYLNSQRWDLTDLPVEFSHGETRFFVVQECLPTNWFLSSGRVPEEAVDTLLGWLDQPRQPGEKRVLVGHFPLLDGHGRALGRRRRLANAEGLRQALADGRLDVSLCGHIHSPFTRREESGSLEVCAGALTVAGKINLVEIAPNEGNVSQTWFDISDPRIAEGV